MWSAGAFLHCTASPLLHIHCTQAPAERKCREPQQTAWQDDQHDDAGLRPITGCLVSAERLQK